MTRDNNPKDRRERDGGRPAEPDLTALNDDPELDPYEIEFLPEFRRGRGPRAPFVNRHGVVIGDHMYESPQSPLNQWSTETDPAVMSGEEWVHPFKDIGFLTEENRDLFEKGIPPQGGVYMHPDKDVAYEAYRQTEQDDEQDNEPHDKQGRKQPE